ncbi:tellurite resistance TerB family protein [Ancylothrix sp. C2]|uniref:tellurite resistance TerB family protein n=1 Tax=Ancylothrix sp. D3o TaxID=2953691 RepID=UPI0021BAC6F6|nr:tellurite resistance TerB family protein [Ancylothrix sp. D3o]MCT7951993.1 tellurite resistance TerB family protein [Ancylothrix sp. D3o]
MGKYDKIITSKEQYAGELNPIEALIALGTIQIFADGKPSEEEIEMLSAYMEGAELTDTKAVEACSEKIYSILQESGSLGGLFNTAIEALPEDFAEDAVTLAVLMAEADGELAKEEVQYVGALGKRLGYSQAELKEIIEAVLEEIYSEEEEEEEEV